VPRAKRPLPLFEAVIVAGGGSRALSACSSGWSSSADQGGGAAATKASAPLYQQIGGVLADGPDLDADPGGAALSQMLPLQDVRGLSRTPTVRKASVIQNVAKLVSADRAFYNSNGTNKTAATAIKNAVALLNTACPGVAS
jgi:hypothetical protein